MWRSNFLIRYSRRAIPLIHSSISTRIPPASPHSVTFLSQNPRFFSQESPNPNPQNATFNENSNFFSQDPDPFFASLDENPSSISEVSETPFDENTNFTSQEGVEENAVSDEQVSSSVVEETKVVEIEIDIEQVESVLSVLQSSLDRSMEDNLDNMDLDLNEEFMVRVIETPSVSGDSLIRFFKWASKKSDFSVSSRLLNSLVRAVGSGLRKREGYAVWDLVKEIGEKQKGVLNTEILNELISLFWKLGKGKAGLEVFNKFEEFGCEPNADSYYLTIEALCRRSIFDWAWPVCEKMLNAGSLPDYKKIGSIISCFCKGKKAKDAHLVYLMAKEKSKCPPRSCVNFLISSLCKEDDSVKLALDLLNDFSGEARRYAIKPFANVVRGLCRIKELEEAKKLLFKMIEESPPPGNAVFNFVINGFSKAGDMDEVTKLVNVMESRGLRPDVYTYSVIISGYVKGGRMDDAREILSKAKKNHSKLCPSIFHTLTRGYCKMEEFDKAVELLNEMKESGVKPNADEYNKMIQSLCLKALDWKTAEKLLEETKENGLHLNGTITSLIRSVKELEEQELGEEALGIEAKKHTTALSS